MAIQLKRQPASDRVRSTHHAGFDQPPIGAWNAPYDGIFTITYISLLIAILSAPLCAAQPLTRQKTLAELHMEFGVDRQTIAEDERLRFTVTVDVPLNVIVQFQTVEDALGALQVTQRYPSGPLELDDPDTQRWQRSYELQPEQQGEHIIPPLAVVFFNSDQSITRTPCLSADRCNRISGLGRNIEFDLADTRRELLTDPITINVTEAAAVSDEPAGQFPGESVSGVRQGLIVATLALVLLAGVIGLSRNRQNGAVVTPRSDTPTTGGITALRALDDLQRDDLIERQHHEEFYNRLTGIIRAYLAEHFQLPTPKTTEELIAAVESGPIAAHRNHLSQLLQQLDQVRFARHRPQPDDGRQLLLSARSFVEQTQPATR
jgi:hypothetical protein